MKTKTLQQTVTFKASPRQVYDMLMDSKKHQSLSGEPAKISRKVGGKFTARGSHISGFNLALRPGEKIVQVARYWMVAGALHRRHLRDHESPRWREAEIYPDRHSVCSLQRSLPRMDRDLLDANEGGIRDRHDQPTNQGSSEDRPRAAHQDGSLPTLDIQRGIAFDRC